METTSFPGPFPSPSQEKGPGNEIGCGNTCECRFVMFCPGLLARKFKLQSVVDAKSRSFRTWIFSVGIKLRKSEKMYRILNLLAVLHVITYYTSCHAIGLSIR